MLDTKGFVAVDGQAANFEAVKMSDRVIINISFGAKSVLTYFVRAPKNLDETKFNSFCKENIVANVFYEEDRFMCRDKDSFPLKKSK